jgi:hypothetical protein
MIRVDLKQGESIFCDNMYINKGNLYCFIGRDSAGITEVDNIDVIYEES